MFEVVFVDGALDFYGAVGAFHVGVDGAFSGGFEVEEGGVEAVQVGAERFLVAEYSKVESGVGVVPDADTDSSPK